MKNLFRGTYMYGLGLGLLLTLTACFNKKSFNNEGLDSSHSIEVTSIFDYNGKTKPNSKGFQVHVNLENTSVEPTTKFHDETVRNESVYIRVRTDDVTGMYAQVLTDTTYILVDADGVKDHIDGMNGSRDVFVTSDIDELKAHLESLGLNAETLSETYSVDLDALIDDMDIVYPQLDGDVYAPQ